MNEEVQKALEDIKTLSEKTMELAKWHLKTMGDEEIETSIEWIEYRAKEILSLTQLIRIKLQEPPL